MSSVEPNDAVREEESAKTPGRVARLNSFIRNSPPVLLVLLALFLLGTGSAAVDRVRWGWDYFHRTSWRRVEYTKLTELHAGYTLVAFERALGPPLLENTKSGYDEYTFRGRDFWVQTVTRHGSPSTLYFAVTSCSLKFNPTFVLSDGTRVTLNEDRLASVKASRSLDVHSDYFFPGATADAWFYDSYPAVNPTNYTSSAWGYDDACPDLPAWFDLESDQLIAEFSTYGSVISGTPYSGPAPVMGFRRKILVNTFAQTAPDGSFAATAGIFNLGVDRIEVRPITNPQVAPRRDFGQPKSRARTKAVPTPLRPPRVTPAERIEQLKACISSPLREGGFVEPAGAMFASEMPPPLALSDLRGYVGGAFFLAYFFKDRRGTPSQATTAIVLAARSVTAANRVAAAIKRAAPRLHVEKVFGGSLFVWNRPPNAEEQYIATWCS